MSVKVENFGCRLNALEGDIAAAMAERAGVQNATIINGCAVTGEAMRQARQAARKAKNAAPDGQAIVTGCAAQTDAAQFTAMPEVDRVLGNAEKLTETAWAGKDNAVGDIMQATRAQTLPNVAQAVRARAFVQVQTGCDHRCTFCIIPFGRGNARSVPVDEVVAQCQRLVAEGHNEIVLTGVDVTSYGPDIGEAGLGSLVRAILARVPELPRLRLSSIDAVEIDKGLLDIVLHEERLMPHLHLSLQAGDNMILKRMKRRHTREEAIGFCDHVAKQRPDVTFGADIIAGFPTETDAMFENSLALVADCNLVWLHVFPFSPRPGTPAARMPQINGATIKARAAQLRAAGERQHSAWLDGQIGKTLSVLVEQSRSAQGQRPALWQGRSESFARIDWPEADAPHAQGQIVDVTIDGHDGHGLQGHLA